MKNWGSTPSLKNLVGVHPMNIHKKFEVNLCSGSSRKTKKVHDNDDDNNNVRRRTEGDRYGHTHSLSETENEHCDINKKRYCTFSLRYKVKLCKRKQEKTSHKILLFSQHAIALLH